MSSFILYFNLFSFLAWTSVVIVILFSLQVEFPEARIYEETLNILLYENRTGPDQELMQATSTRGAVAGMSSYTSDEEEERSGLARLRSNKQNNT
jgi:BTB/POZ domain-containing adapter for CUL3-mediated RhoA degradation protein